MFTNCIVVRLSQDESVNLFVSVSPRSGHDEIAYMLYRNTTTPVRNEKTTIIPIRSSNDIKTMKIITDHLLYNISSRFHETSANVLGTVHKRSVGQRAAG